MAYHSVLACLLPDIPATVPSSPFGLVCILCPLHLVAYRLTARSTYAVADLNLPTRTLPPLPPLSATRDVYARSSHARSSASRLVVLRYWLPYHSTCLFAHKTPWTRTAQRRPDAALPVDLPCCLTYHGAAFFPPIYPTPDLFRSYTAGRRADCLRPAFNAFRCRTRSCWLQHDRQLALGRFVRRYTHLPTHTHYYWTRGGPQNARRTTTTTLPPTRSDIWAVDATVPFSLRFANCWSDILPCWLDVAGYSYSVGTYHSCTHIPATCLTHASAGVPAATFCTPAVELPVARLIYYKL